MTSNNVKRKKTVSKPNPLIEKAIRVSDRVQIKDIFLLGNTSKWKNFASNKDNNFKISKNAQATLNDDKTHLLAIINFAVDLLDNEKKTFAEINVDFLIVYSISNLNGLTQEHYDSFANYNAVYNAWPYLREFVQNITSKMQMPTLTIPVYRFGNDQLPTTGNVADEQKQLDEKTEQKV